MHLHTPDAILFKLFTIIQAIINKQSFNGSENIVYRKFITVDEGTQKIVLNLESLENYSDDRIHFVGLIENDQNSFEELTVFISEKPISIQCGISYFLLKTNTCQVDFLRILYILSHSLYADYKYVSEIELKISKIIDIDGAWSHSNFLYILTQSSETHSGIKTAAETKQLIYRQSKQIIFEKQLAISEQLEIYFSQVYVMSTRKGIGREIESIRENLRIQSNGYIKNNHFSSYYFIFDGLLNGFKNELTCSRPVKIKHFHEINIGLICEELVCQVKQNYKIISEEMLENEQNSSQKLQSLIENLKKESLRSIDQAKKINWLNTHPIFKNRQKNIRREISEKTNKLHQTLLFKEQRKDMNIIEDEGKKNRCNILGNKKFDQMNLDFGVYRKYLDQEINELFQMLSEQKWREEGKTISNNKQLLQNLETRLQINDNKKKGLLQAIELAEKQYKTLSELPLRVAGHS